ncbi:MAG TPA: metallophosphoesterase [Acidimicrobiales bacterium]|nr:metallophosphoesterase [Acidimicrobiales bacterium]
MAVRSGGEAASAHAGCPLALPTPVVAAIAALLLLVAGCSAEPDDTSVESNTSTTSTVAVPTTTTAAPVVTRIVAAGDIACVPGKPVTPGECRMAATAALVDGLHPDVVLPLGDLQYELGKVADFSASYDATWGRFKAITRPVPGNHEYAGGKAKGYFGYFGAAAHGPDGWYSFDVPSSWHVVVLNSVCAAVGGCGPGSRQYEWLRADLDATTSECIVAAWHHPRWSSGLHHSDDTYEPFWQLLAQHGADLVLSGHDHHFERFAPKEGIVQIVAGTGGRSLYPIASREPGSAAAQARGFGVVELDLRPGGYTTTYRPVSGLDFSDGSTRSCE